jgi:peptide-methionine (S)-S-oxide reductase
MKTEKKTYSVVITGMFLTIFLVGCDQSQVSSTSEAYAEPVSQNTLSEQEGTADQMEKATFGAGCFWGVEAAFRQVKGVSETAVGYMGGTLNNPSYKDVCYKETGHAEVVEVTFDPEKVSYDRLLEVFWSSHDPTQVNRQGPDHGTQYRTAIFFHSLEQQQAATASREQLDSSGKFPKKIATEIAPAATFWKAEDYHQQYLEKRGLATCHIQ